MRGGASGGTVDVNMFEILKSYRLCFCCSGNIISRCIAGYPVPLMQEVMSGRRILGRYRSLGGGGGGGPVGSRLEQPCCVEFGFHVDNNNSFGTWGGNES